MSTADTRLAAYNRWLLEHRLLNLAAAAAIVDVEGRRRPDSPEVADELYRLWEKTAAPVTTPVNVVAEVDALLARAPQGSARAIVIRHLLAWLHRTPTPTHESVTNANIPDRHRRRQLSSRRRR